MPVPVSLASPDFSAALTSWYQRVKRDLPWRRTHDPYAIWVSEVMLQQTQVKTVIPYYQRFLERFPSLECLAAASLDEVLTAWRGLGYYTRARHLWGGARYVAQTLHGELPQTHSGWRQIPGIGEYTAGAIASIAFGEAVPAIDGNVRRILSRILAWPHPVENSLSQQTFRAQLLEWLPNTPVPGDFNQALMELGATICLPKNPSCSVCPVSAWCQAQVTDDFNYPVKRTKTKPFALTRLTFVLLHQGQVYLQKRPADGLLADLWEFPGVELPASIPSDMFADPETMVSHFKEALAIRSYDLEAQTFFQTHPMWHGPARHAFSHLHWHIYWVIMPISGLPFPSVLRASEASAEYHWLPIRELNTAPIPTAFRKVIESCQNESTPPIDEIR